MTNGKELSDSVIYYLNQHSGGSDVRKKIFIIGGTNAVSTNVENMVKPYAESVVRIAGNDRYETSLAIANAIGDFDTAFVTTGLNYADALSVSSISAKNASPIILTNGQTIKDETASYINRKAKNTYILGGTSAVSGSIDAKLNNSYRISGIDRYETNKNIVSTFKNELTSQTAYVATGTNFPDALAASAVAGRSAAPIILTAATPSQFTKDIIKDQNLNELIAVGGYSVLSPLTMENLAGRTPSTDASGTVSISDIQKYAVSRGMRPMYHLNNNPANLYLEEGNGYSMNYVTYFADNNLGHCLSYQNFMQTNDYLTIATTSGVRYKDYLYPMLQKALPHSYDKLFTLLTTIEGLKSQELYLDGKVIEIENGNYDGSLTINYTPKAYTVNPSMKPELKK